MSNREPRNRVTQIGSPFKHALGAACAVSLMAGCGTTSAPDYRPAIQGDKIGYSDLQLSPKSYRVSFQGSTASTRDDVEKYLLRRAAEVTLQTGHTHFVLANRDTERDEHLYLHGPAYYYYPYSYRYWSDDTWSEESYSAYADVVMFDSNEAANDPRAIDAISLLQRLQWQSPPYVASAALPR